MVDYITTRTERLEREFDAYMEQKIKEERIICETLEILMSEGSGWSQAEPQDLEPNVSCPIRHRLALRNSKNDIGVEQIDLGRWDASLELFLVEGVNDYLSLSEVEVYV